MGYPLTSSLRGFAADAYYIGADAGAFNAVGDAGSFGAYCTFIINGSIQRPGGVPVRQWLWGNAVDASFSGWSLELVETGGELELQAKVGNGAAYVATTEPITGAAVAATGQLPAAGAFERLIQASLWCDNVNLILAVNGTICNWTAFDAATLSPSLVAATLGAGSAAVPAFPATGVRIVSCGYTNFPGLNVPGNAPAFIGGAYTAARQTGNSAYISQNAGIDWTHRYDVNLAGQNLRGTLNRTAAGTVGTLPVAPTTIVDVGSSGRANLALPAVTPVNLVRGGAGSGFPLVDQESHADWANMGTFFFTP